MKSLSFIIPVYNSERTIPLVIKEIEQAVQTLEAEYNYEVILVNDFSKDNTLKVCKQLYSTKPFIKLISFSRNFGQHHALMAGLRKATGDYIICLDDDLQTPPKEIHKLIETLEEGYDVVYGQYTSKKHSHFRNAGSKLNDLMANYLINKPSHVDMTSFFIARKYIIDEVVQYTNPYPYLGGLIFRATQNIGGVNVDHMERKIGKSNYNFKKLITLWFSGFTNFSVKPLRLASFIGFLFASISFLAMLVLILRRLTDPHITMGWTSMIISIAFFGGVQLVSMGLLGEYVGRIYLCINKTPQYVIRDQYDENKVVDYYEKCKAN